ncbi:hypothetical protein GW17_00024901 [Ensete ventricosum]|nr:hypothetical protein GW17_00024901 [Ensete ventricosum]RZR88397.1 hypothetical protein BHM03_00015969 [Ensete ventricosum]
MQSGPHLLPSLFSFTKVTCGPPATMNLKCPKFSFSSYRVTNYSTTNSKQANGGSYSFFPSCSGAEVYCNCFQSIYLCFCSKEIKVGSFRSFWTEYICSSIIIYG